MTAEKKIQEQIATNQMRFEGVAFETFAPIGSNVKENEKNH